MYSRRRPEVPSTYLYCRPEVPCMYFCHRLNLAYRYLHFLLAQYIQQLGLVQVRTSSAEISILVFVQSAGGTLHRFIFVSRAYNIRYWYNSADVSYIYGMVCCHVSYVYLIDNVSARGGRDTRIPRPPPEGTLEQSSDVTQRRDGSAMCHGPSSLSGQARSTTPHASLLPACSLATVYLLPSTHRQSALCLHFSNAHLADDTAPRQGRALIDIRRVAFAVKRGKAMRVCIPQVRSAMWREGRRHGTMWRESGVESGRCNARRAKRVPSRAVE